MSMYIRVLVKNLHPNIPGWIGLNEVYEKLENIKGVTESHKTKNDWQYKGYMKKYNTVIQNTTQKPKV
jgi:hypothetical protein